MIILQKIFTLFILLLPVLRYYEVPLLRMDFSPFIQIMLFIVGIVFFLGQKKKISVKKTRGLFKFTNWFIIITLMALLISSLKVFDYININGYVFFLVINAFLIIGIYGAFDFDYGIKIYLLLSKTIIIFFIVQMILYYSFGLNTVLKIPFINIQDIYVDSFAHLLISSQYQNPIIRFSSFFSEPSHYTQYLLPYLIMKMYGLKHLVKQNFKEAILISLAIILSFSGNAIVLIALIWIFYFLFNQKSRISKKVIVSLIGFLILSGSFYLLMNIYTFEYILSRMFTSAEGASSKADYRIYRGWTIYFNLPFMYMLFGVGYRNATAVIKSYELFTIYDVSGESLEYLNTISQIMINTGFIGFVLFIKWFSKLYLDATEFGKSLVFVLLVLSVSSSIFLGPIWTMYLLLIYGSLDKIVIKGVSK